jgi:hypothetical protein
MVPVTLPPNVSVAPSEVLEMIKCGCTTDTPCSTAMCECDKAHFPWSMFCGCHWEVNCHNEYTQRVDVVEDCDSGDLCEYWIKSGACFIKGRNFTPGVSSGLTKNLRPLRLPFGCKSTIYQSVLSKSVDLLPNWTLNGFRFWVSLRLTSGVTLPRA